MAEKHGFRQFAGNGGAIDRNERRLGPRAAEMDGARDKLLAGPAFPGDENAGVGELVEAMDFRHNFLHLLAAAHQTCQVPARSFQIGNDREFFIGLFQRRIPPGGAFGFPRSIRQCAPPSARFFSINSRAGGEADVSIDAADDFGGLKRFDHVIHAARSKPFHHVSVSPRAVMKMTGCRGCRPET